MKVSEIWNDEFINLSLIYAGEYEKDGKVFISSFFKFNSIRWACREIVIVYKNTGALAECSGDFSEWANKQKIQDKWKPVLSQMLTIIYSITNNAQSVEKKEV